MRDALIRNALPMSVLMNSPASLQLRAEHAQRLIVTTIVEGRCGHSMLKLGAAVPGRLQLAWHAHPCSA